ncbi:MAG: beta-ketoacyl-ACP synthase II [Planctomycetota bacterium]
MEKRRVVITGLGAATALGTSAEGTWENMLAGKNGVAILEHFDTSEFPVKFGAYIKDFDGDERFGKSEARKIDRSSQLAVHCADEAIQDADLSADRENVERIGVIMGSGIGGISETETQHARLLEKGPRKVSPFLVPKMMVNSMSGQIAIRHGYQGPNFATASACASAGHALGMALRTIQYNDADVMIAGGAEAAVTPLTLAGFCSLKALSTRNDDPAHASRPFDRDRDGFVLGEGASVMVLEELEHAKKRGAKIYAELVGFANNDDAYHITAPSPDGRGAARALQLAVADARIDPALVDYINAHGTSTPYNDKSETAAIKAAFGDHARKIAVSSTKSMIGHLLGASGAVELMVCVMSVFRNVVPPTINYQTKDPECDLDYVPNEAREMRVRYAMSNSLGFGGHNTSLIVGKID